MEPRNKPSCKCSHIFKEGAKTTNQGKESVFEKWCWESRFSGYKSMNLDPYLAPYTEINSKWIKDLTVKPRSIKLLEEKQKKSCITLTLAVILGQDVESADNRSKNRQMG